MTTLVWDENKFALGVAEMDAAHREFIKETVAVAKSSDDEFPALFNALAEHTRRHFEEEEALMRAHRFPATEEHQAEHRRILAELDYLSRRVAGGRIAMARAYMEGLPIWFANHLATMDAALAACIKQQSGLRAVH